MRKLTEAITSVARNGLSAALITAALSLNCAASAQDMELKVGYYRGSFFGLSDYVAVEEGIYSKNGLKVDLINIGSGPEQISAVASGGIDVISNSASAILVVRSKGLDLIGIVNNQAVAIYSLMAQKDLTRPNKSEPYPKNMIDLKGRTIGVFARSSDVEMVARFLLKDAGLNPDRDVTWVALGGIPTQIAAFRAKTVDYLISNEPVQTVLVDVGKLGDYVVDQRKGEGNKLFSLFTSNMAAARRSAVEASPEKFRRFAKARAEAMQFMSDPKNFDRLIEILGKYSALDRETLVTMTKNNLSSFSPNFDCQAIANVVKFNIESGLLSADKAPSCTDFVWNGSAEYIKK